MAYVPQFIPTNTQALQGTLDQYQKAADMETNLQNQATDIYSAIPTNSITDTADKNKIMGQFTSVLGELDKKYNYDRSNQQYAKDLTREITKLRSNPLWSHVQKKDELSKLRTNLIANKGADYYENFNPNDVSLTDAQKLQSWKPLDLKDVREAAALAAKEHANSIGATTYDKSSIPGYIFRTEHTGYKDTNEASQYLNSHEGKAWLDQSISSRGFDPKDPVMYKQAYTAALSNLVGTEKTDPLIDRAYVEGLRTPRTGKTIVSGDPWIKTTNAGQSFPIDVSKMSNLQNVDSRITELSQKDNPTDADKVEINNLQLAKDQATDIIAETTNANKAIVQTGKSIINKGIADNTINTDQIYNKLRDYYVNTSGIGRTGISPVLGTAYEYLKPTTSFVSGMTQYLTNSFKNILPFFDKDVAQEGMATAIKTIDRSLHGDKLNKAKDNTKLAMAMTITEDIIKEKAAKGIYGDVNSIGDSNTSTKAITAEWQKLLPQVYNTTDEFSKYYNGKGNYVNNGYNKIEDTVNAKLKSGKTYVADVYAPGINTKPAEYKQFTDFVSNNLNAFDVTEEGQTKPLTDKQKQSVDVALADGKSKIQLIANREAEPVILMTDSKGNKHKLTMNIAKMGTDVLDEFVTNTGRPEFLDGIYKDYKFENRPYTLNDKDKYLKNMISQRYKNITPFEGLAITQNDTPGNGIDYTVSHPAFGSTPVNISSKYVLMRSLDEIFKEYYLNQQSNNGR
jgi:hypothetical protein